REIGGTKGRFTLRDDRGTTLRAGRIVLAYGRQDRVPDVPGLAERLGTSVFHCPDCDGPSVEGRTVAVLGHDRAAASLALYLLTWAERAILMTDGRAPDLDPRAHRTLRRADVEIVTGSVERLLGPDLTLSGARVGPDDVPIDGLFFHWGSEPTTDLAATAGLDRDPEDVIRVDPHTLETSTPGIYAAGDIIGQPYLAISAAAQGVRAALAAHRSLLPDDFRL
ncbi:MAG: FAD-dependent oxidoreductase, partial [Gemmatimonadetes bacterium]|nr:NAD(P)/FAD-dependent oxidoreductase [Gemmatimonadota bacterium]NIQ59252.1 NAD(P)/FAD-dependent oxidoreductase [Gemmatimonadota bacterium]NIU79435.1 FAD-dependent oxidoreductase [Gammaproteobacteria bacterium]NIX48083.1 FAD-dependent oxidoreductase [Gemmatimonadota bacterium]NIY12466.1 FAD-dependent oxidoreductase [Gemmatimonadota bacterium]